MQRVFSNHNGMKIEISNRKIPEKLPQMFRNQIKILLKSPMVEEIKRE